MADDVLINKAATIERCVRRAREEYAADPTGYIESSLAEKLKRMVGFRNIAVHDYASLQLPVTVRIIETHLDEFLELTSAILLRDANPT